MRCWLISCLLLSGLAASGCGNGEAWGTPMVTETRRCDWENPMARGQEITTAHYNIYTTAFTPSLVNCLPGFMEAAYRNYLVLTGLPDRRQTAAMDLYMFGTRREWVALTTEVTGSLADKYLGIQAGGYCYQGVCVFWDIGGLGTFAVASHEGLHQFLHHRLKHRLPACLEEGLCTLAEGYEISQRNVRFTPRRNTLRHNDLAEAIANGYWIPLPDLLIMDAGDITTGMPHKAVGYYGQLWALVSLLRSDDRYRDGLQRLIKDAEEGNLHTALKLSPQAMEALLRQGRLYNRSVSEALFKHYICEDLEGFSKAYYEFANRLVNFR